MYAVLFRHEVISMKTKIPRLLAVALASLVLIGCGGGSESSSSALTAVSATAFTEVKQPIDAVADAVLTQASTSISVTPGETFRTTLLTVGCPLMKGAGDVCAKAVPLGEVGFRVSLELEELKLLYNGREIWGQFSNENGLYRFIPWERVELWQPGSAIELTSVVSPRSMEGEKSLVVVFAGSASFDKTLELVDGTANVEVLPLPHLAPAVITSPRFSFAKEATYVDVEVFQYECPPKVAMGCMLESFNVGLNNGVSGTSIGVTVTGDTGGWGSGNVDFVDSGPTSVYQYPYFWVQPGARIAVRVMVNLLAGGSLIVTDIRSQSGGKIIKPSLPIDCTIASNQRCKA